MAKQQQNIPDEIDFNDSDIAAANKRRTFRPTGDKRFVRFVVTGAEKKISEDKGTMMIALTCAPLKDPDVVDSKGSPTIRHTLIIPKANKEFAGHKAPNTAGLCHGYYRAVMADDMPAYPRFNKETGKSEFDGEELTREEAEEKRLEVTAAVTKQLSADWKVPNNRVDDAFFAEVVDNNGYSNLRNIRGELPEDGELVPEDQWVAGPDDAEEDEEEDEDEEEEEDKKPAKKAAKPAAKPAAKKPVKKGKK